MSEKHPLTERQKEIHSLLLNGATTQDLVKELGITPRAIRDHVLTIKNKGYSVHPENVSEKIGYVAGKITSHQILNEETGEFIERQRWVREHPEQLLMEEFMVLLENKVIGKFPEIKCKNNSKSEQSLIIPIGDPHLGMLAWGKETGEDYDLQIGRDIHFNYIIDHIDSAKNPECIYILPLGDLLHSDSRLSKTEKSGHVLDTDTRYFKIVEVVENLLIDIITYAAQKSPRVIFSAVQGNHDWHGSMWISRLLRQAFKNTQHIEIDVRPQKQRYFEYHNNLFGITHGDTERKISNLAAIMSHDEREAWGRTQHHYWYTGHIHQQKIHEFPSCVVESFNTLAPKDSYASEYAYRSRRKLTSIILDRQAGEVERRNTVLV